MSNDHEIIRSITSNKSVMRVNDTIRICVVVYRWAIVVCRAIGHAFQFVGLDFVMLIAHFCLINFGTFDIEFNFFFFNFKIIKMDEK